MMFAASLIVRTGLVTELPKTVGADCIASLLPKTMGAVFSVTELPKTIGANGIDEVEDEFGLSNVSSSSESYMYSSG